MNKYLERRVYTKFISYQEFNSSISCEEQDEDAIEERDFEIMVDFLSKLYISDSNSNLNKS